MFIGRDQELRELHNAFKKNESLLMVMTGRRRIGKSTLIEEFGKSIPYFFEFQGLHPKEGPTKQSQLLHFSNKLKIYFKRPQMKFDSWLEAFSELQALLPKKPCLLFLDEISWMSTGSASFSGELKDAWDTLFKKHPHLVVAVAGSVSSWIEDNILNSSNFLGRVSLQIHLEELPLTVQKNFWKQRKDLVSNYDFFKTVCVLGGIPRYLEAIDPTESPEENIHRLCFRKSGFMVYEFEKIFSDIFSRRGPIYRKIVSQLIDGPLTLTELAKKMKVEKSGSLSAYLDDLIKSGFLSEDTVYDIQGRQTKFVRFRIKDNYLRFALKYIEPNKKKILDGSYAFSSLENLPAWKTIIGYQFENLILNNRWHIIKKLEIDPSTVISCSPYFQRKTAKNKGACQIDLLIITKNFQVYICEIKFAAKVATDVIEEMQEKIQVFKRPRHYTIHPVLIYGGELSPKVRQSQLFELISIDDLA